MRTRDVFSRVKQCVKDYTSEMTDDQKWAVYSALQEWAVEQMAGLDLDALDDLVNDNQVFRRNKR